MTGARAARFRVMSNEFWFWQITLPSGLVGDRTAPAEVSTVRVVATGNSGVGIAARRCRGWLWGLGLAGLLAGLPCSAQGAKGTITRPLLYFGACNASGSVAVDTNRFLVADDENNTIRLYCGDRGGLPLREFDFDAFLEVERQGNSREADLEAGARIGDRAFWIGSHGRNKNGKERSNRHRFFATDIRVTGDEVALEAVGKPCKTLLDELILDARFDALGFAAGAGKAPKERGAVNIEGLSATPEGHLLIGFRNPVPQGKALLIPLLNPNEVVQGSRPRFGPAIRLDLGGLGIRDMALWGESYLIIAGSWHGGGPFQLYLWDGPGSDPKPLSVKHLNDYQPEAIIIYPDKGLREFQILSDDGSRLRDGVVAREIADPRQQCFRSFWVRRSAK